MSKSHSLYEPIDGVPEGLRWKPIVGCPNHAFTVMLSIPGNRYKLVRDRSTGAVAYFKLKDEGPPMSPPEVIDAEPEPEKQVRYHVGKLAWLVEYGRWFLVKIVERKPRRIVIAPESTHDADRLTEWPHGDLLEFPARPSNPLFARLRPLKARYR